MKTVLVITALLLASAAFADDDVHYRHHGMTVILKSSDKPISIIEGDNDLDKPHTFTCVSAAGCVVTIVASDINTANGNTMTCGLIDGEPALPGCVLNGDLPIPTIHEQSKVSAGQHTLQTILHTLHVGGQVTSWETEYTIYERRVRGTN